MKHFVARPEDRACNTTPILEVPFSTTARACLRSVTFLLATAAAVGSRAPFLEIADWNGTVIGIPATAAVPANDAAYFVWAPGAALMWTSWCSHPLAQNLWLPPGCSLVVNCTAIDAADMLRNICILWDEEEPGDPVA